MKKYLFLLLLATTPALSQIEFVPGYFIDNTNKKTECLIRDEGWKNNPTEFRYKLDEVQKDLVATIDNTAEFGITDGTKFIRFKVNVDGSSNNINEFSTVKNPEFTLRTIFLKVLVEGEINLFSYESGNQLRFFIYKKQAETAEQLIHKNYLVDGTTFSENNYFRQQLFTILKSDKFTAKDFEYLEYEQDRLVKLFDKYYGSTGKTYTNHEKLSAKTSINLKVTAGINFSGVSLSGGLGNADISTGLNATPGFGVELESVLPYNHGKWSLFVNPNFHHFKYEEKPTSQVLKIDYKLVSIPLGLRHYMFLTKDSRIFIDGGYNLGISLSSTLQYGGLKFDVESGSNMFLGLGYNYKKYSLVTRYNFMHSMINYSNWAAGYGSIQIMFAYKIF